MLCSNVVRALGAVLHDSRAAEDLALAALALAPDADRLARPLLRLTAEAHAQGHSTTVVALLIRLCDLGAFEGRVPAEWLAGDARPDHRRECLLRVLLRRWIPRFGASHDGVRRVVRENSHWLLSPGFGIRLLREIHAREPTVEGWIAMA